MSGAPCAKRRIIAVPLLARIRRSRPHATYRKSADKDASEASATPRIPSMHPCGCDSRTALRSASIHPSGWLSAKALTASSPRGRDSPPPLPRGDGKARTDTAAPSRYAPPSRRARQFHLQPPHRLHADATASSPKSGNDAQNAGSMSASLVCFIGESREFPRNAKTCE